MWSRICLLGIALAAGLGAAEEPGDTGRPPRLDDLLDWRVDGEALQVDQMRLFGLEFHDLVSVPTKTGKLLTFTNLAAAAYGGRVTGTFAVHILDGDLHLDLDLVDIDLGQFLESFAGIAGYGGKVDGRVSLRLPRARWSRAEGEARLKLANGSVIHAPGAANLLFGDPGARQGKDTGVVTATIDRGRVKIEEFRIENDSYQVAIKGDLDDEGTLDLTVSPFAKMDHLSSTIPLLGDPIGFVINRISGRVGRFDVRGHISAPVILFRPF